MGWKKPAWRKTERSNESHDWCTELLGMRMPTDRWPKALKVFLVVNDFKLHLNAFKIYLKFSLEFACPWKLEKCQLSSTSVLKTSNLAHYLLAKKVKMSQE